MSSGLHAFLLRIKTLFRKRRMDRDMAEELEFHQSMLRDKLAGQGVPNSELKNAARQTFGDPGRWHERLRELWQFRRLENLLRDISFSARLLKKSPGIHHRRPPHPDHRSRRQHGNLLTHQWPVAAPTPRSPCRTACGVADSRRRSRTWLQLLISNLSWTGTAAQNLLGCVCVLHRRAAAGAWPQRQ